MSQGEPHRATVASMIANDLAGAREKLVDTRVGDTLRDSQNKDRKVSQPCGVLALQITPSDLSSKSKCQGRKMDTKKTLSPMMHRVVMTIPPLRELLESQSMLSKIVEERDREPKGTAFKIADRLVLETPSPQTALDIFRGSWLSRMPADYAAFHAGEIPLFDDLRIPEGMKQLGSLEGKKVLDIGPLEGGHAYLLEKMGAETIISVEANSLLYLKCLVAKEILGMRRVQFLCGDINKYLEHTDQTFDMCLASGVLYHMADPVRLLWLIAGKTSNLLLWTHFFDDENRSRNKFDFKGETVNTFNGVHYDYHRQEYGAVFESDTYAGGTRNYSNWMSKNGITTALQDFGFRDVKILQEEDSDRGPYLLMAARK